MTVYFTEVPDRQIDPPERPDMTEAEYRARRVRIVRSMPLTAIEDAVVEEAAQLAAILSIEYALQERRGRAKPNEWGRTYLAERLNDLLRPHIDAYIEHELEQGR